MKILIFPLLIISQIIFSQAGFLKLGNNINGEASGDESGISVGINSLGNKLRLEVIRTKVMGVILDM